MNDILSTTGHRPWPLPRSPWAMTQRWNDLLFAHWPVPAAELVHLLPPELVVDTFDGTAWVGVVPFWMDQVRMRGVPPVPGASRFPELNLRTYVRERNSNRAGVYFFSLDAASLLAVAFARTIYRLPYYWARMRIEETGTGTRAGNEFRYTSERKMTQPRAGFRATYRSLGRQHPKRAIEQFLTERYALYTADPRGKIFRGNIHHLPWTLEEAEADFEINELPLAHGIRLPAEEPLLHYSRQLVVYVWSLESLPAPGVRTAGAPVPAAP
ncbi:YqjF family protein [Paracidobacterium acidisoli]|uniref:DUF2071 domain-containing protein n=1 Tax=Paracidobacterium acidisoli TaxID=2303751 RepID=A0A372IKS9_9BACT|nr:DUF2071 domain-containing protein [Paracidobacterium acidisoli]MBT9332910.1 DUF2071 domain-containing protein [Paracidobacterium acidisoli]